MPQTPQEDIHGIRTKLRLDRRELHALAEPGWCEFATATKIVNAVRKLGWNVAFGRSVMSDQARMGVPSSVDLERWFERARRLCHNDPVLEDLRGGFTGVVATLTGAHPGPVCALRFDIDANLGAESSDSNHVPAREGFASTHPGTHHNCGHDGHTSIGLALAEWLTQRREHLRGEIRLVFQPAEEGLRGAASMVDAGVLRNVDLLLGCHIGVQALEVGEVIIGYNNILGSVKLDVRLQGVAAHASLSPHKGKNALLAACAAVQGLYSISQHGDGETRVNVGRFTAGTSRNTIPPEAFFEAEIRGETAEIVRFLETRASEMIRGTALAHGVTTEIQRVGASCPASSSPEGVELIRRAATSEPIVTKLRNPTDFKACDDVAVMMTAVQDSGGKAVYFGLGSQLAGTHHSPSFDFDERSLEVGLRVMWGALREAGALPISLRS